MDCWCDYDPPELYCRDIRRARKPHRCEECSGRIAIGETYEHISGKWDGYMDRFKTCSRCVDLRTWVTNNVPCFCWAHSNMLDDAKETVNEAAIRGGDEAAGLRFGFLRRRVAIERFNTAARVPA